MNAPPRTMDSPDRQAVRDFLDHICDSRPLDFVAVLLDGPIEAKTFDTAEGAVDWVIDRNASRNIYFSVNEPKAGFRDHKAAKGDSRSTRGKEEKTRRAERGSKGGKKSSAGPNHHCRRKNKAAGAVS